MAIELYDKAKVIKKDNKYYYFLKHGSKNSFTCRGQSILDNNFRNKFICRDSRDSHWMITAIGGEKEYQEQAIANTYWNTTTSQVYGKIAFGNKKNIALYYVKTPAQDFYTDFDDRQRANIDKLIAYAENCRKEFAPIDLANIDEARKFKAHYEYCGKPVVLEGNSLSYKGKIYWNLDNL